MGDWRMSADLLARARFVVSPMADVSRRWGRWPSRATRPSGRRPPCTARPSSPCWRSTRSGRPCCAAPPGPGGGRTSSASLRSATRRPSRTSSRWWRALGDERIRADLVETVGDAAAGGAAPAGRHGGGHRAARRGCGPASSPATGRAGSGCCAPTSWRVRPGWPAPAGRRCCRTSAGTAPGSATAGCGSTSSTTPPATWATAHELSFVPHHGTGSHVGWELPTRYALYYPVTGVLAEPRGRPSPAARAARGASAAARLIGGNRARLLAALADPASTTGLVGAHRAPARFGRPAPAGAAGRRAGAATAVRPGGPLLAHRAGRRARGRVTAR